MYTLETIIFDMDGTLADTEEIHRQAFNAAFNQHNIPYQWDQTLYKKLLAISGGKERIKQYLIDNNFHPEHKYTLTELAIIIHKTKSEIYRQMLVDGHVGLRTGVKRLIGEAIDKNITLAIATSSSTSNVETLLKSALGNSSLDLFQTIVTSDIVEDKKPSPAVYNYVLNQLGTDSNNCITLEDTFNGNRAALSANISTVITTHLYTEEDDFDGASLVINHLGEPDLAMMVQSGNAYGANFVDIELLNHILEDRAQASTYKKSAKISAK